ncbi:class I SAM-dependent methyltransferase [Candidatus Kaiserbacteria bacterium]|nr:class I SAM-dependent methyltransferase [Candidatus Kaiserbacteria bacterium]
MNKTIKKLSVTDLYLKSCLPNASEWETKKIKNDWVNKERAAEGLYNDFVKRVGSPVNKKVLEIGFGNGLQVVVFAKNGALMSGVEVESVLYTIASENISERKLTSDLRLYDGTIMPFENDYFDYIYTTSVFEHVSDLTTMLNEIYRVLKPGGKVYISFPNRLWPKETHTGIWFANYLPLPVVRFLFKIFKRSSIEDWNLHFLTFFSVIKRIRKNNIPLIVVYELYSQNVFKRILKKFFSVFGIHHSAFLRTVMIILKKDS